MIRLISLLGLLFTTAMLGFEQPQPKKKAIETFFNHNCKTCHEVNKTTRYGPSFQGIRTAYGKEWAIKFVKHTSELVSQKDINALYSIAVFYPVKHIQFVALDDDFVVKIFDYVDSFKYDSTQTRHRKVSLAQKRRTVDSISSLHVLYE